ncbi:MAG: GNAT family N-acetyltransferase [Chloroflexi bacterium]|nr:GNAT family N-acetyltransferase [Chloroflexota bacterium]MCC6893789.1 GNAT family N-acetyltransferase [Anaerolineae bacterium]
MSVSLRPVTAENWHECVRLKVDESQNGFVAPNVYSLAQAKFEPESVPLAIYNDDQMVGFLMYHPEDYQMAKIWFIERLMVGHPYQGKGYGRAAMQTLIDELRAQPGYQAILISFVPENTAAKKLYASLGFDDTGEIEEGEMVYRMALDK